MMSGWQLHLLIADVCLQRACCIFLRGQWRRFICPGRRLTHLFMREVVVQPDGDEPDEDAGEWDAHQQVSALLVELGKLTELQVGSLLFNASCDVHAWAADKEMHEWDAHAMALLRSKGLHPSAGPAATIVVQAAGGGVLCK
jgi:hypothetical protein